MRPKIKILCSVLSAAVICVGVGVSGAYITDNEEKTNSFSFQRAELAVREELWDSLPEKEKTVSPGKTVTKDPTVENTGTADMFVFLELRVPSLAVRTVSDDGKSIIEAKMTPLFDFSVNEMWMPVEQGRTSDGCEKLVYGYCEALKSGQKTLPLFQSVTCANYLEGELDMGAELKLDLRAYGIQSDYVDVGQGEVNIAEIYKNYREEFCGAGGTEV